MIPTIRVAPTPDELALLAATRFIQAAQDAIVATGWFTVALSGGSTPQAMFKALVSDELIGKVDWPHLHILFADERCVPPDHPDSNFGMACRLLLDHVPVPYENIHRMAGEKDPHQAADDYDRLLREQFPKGLDLIFLGMGEDGHTASLFPGTQALSVQDRFCVANHVPNFSAWRLTMTPPCINSAFEVVVLLSGKNKAPVATSVLEARAIPGQYPIQLIEPRSSRLAWFLDAQAAAMDEPPDDAEAAPDDAPEDEDQQTP